MQIVFDSQIFGIQRFGGISRYIVELADTLGSIDNVDARILAPLHVNQILGASDVARRGVSWMVPKLRSGIRRRVEKIATELSLSTGSFDILHSTYYLRHCRPRNSKALVVTVHDMIHEIMPGSFPEDDPTVNLKRKSVEAADHVICVSENTRQDLCRLLDVDVMKTSVVHHGVSFRDPLNIVSYAFSRPYVLYVGQRGGYKNFDLFLRAFALTPARKSGVALVAFGGSGFSRYELQLIEGLGFTNGSVIHMSGDDELLSALYSGALAFIYPSLYEGFGMPVLEAMSMGCPVAAANSSSIPEAGGDAVEYFDPTSQDDIARAIDVVVSSPSRSRALREKGFCRAKAFSWRKAAEETLGVYRNLVPMAV